jgi:hypothetical protein
MAYAITLNGTPIQYLPTPENYSKQLSLAGAGVARAIDATLVDLGSVVKRRWSLTVYVGPQAAFLEGLLALASFVFVDHDGTSFTVKATSLMVNRWPIAIVGTAQLSLEEV